MLATRASTRNVQRIARNFATVVESSGVKVAAADHNQPTSSVTFLVKAGSRYEPKPGVAHALKNFAFKSTANRSTIGTVRESELYGGQLSSSLTREHLALTAEFLRGDESYFVDVLSSFVTSAKFTRHEFEEYVLPTVQGDALAAQANPAVRALETAHTIAFRNGLGSSLFAPAHNSVTSEDVKSFAQTAFSKDNIVVIGTGIDQATLSNLLEKSLSKLSASASSTGSTSYFGGETRVEGHGGPQTVFIGYGVTGAPSAELATLATLLSTEASVKWSQGLSPLASKVPEGAHVQSVYLPYSDASLIGFLVQGNTAADVKAASKAAVEALKASASADAEALKRAAAKAKFAAASAAEGRDGLVATIGTKVFGGSAPSLDATLSAFDSVNPSSFSKATSELIKAKPTFVAVGDVQSLPYPDELGL